MSELHPENLISLSKRTPEERKKIASAGGYKSNEVRRKKKLMSEIYAKSLSQRYDVKIKGEIKRISGEKMLLSVISEILMRRDSASVALMKEIREATEGNNINLSGSVEHTPAPEDRLAAFRELKQKAEQNISSQDNADVDSPAE